MGRDLNEVLKEQISEVLEPASDKLPFTYNIDSSSGKSMDELKEEVRLAVTEHGVVSVSIDHNYAEAYIVTRQDIIDFDKKEEIQQSQFPVYEIKDYRIEDPFDKTNRDKTVAVRTEPKIGRNKPCPCGSGDKFKKCCINK